MSLRSKNNFLGKIIIFIWIVLLALSMFGLIVEASNDYVTTPIDPEDNQYFELRATNIDEKNGYRQVTMELRGHNIEFNGFIVKFKYDKTKLQTSSLTSNEEADELSDYYAPESEFATSLRMFTYDENDINLGDNVGVIHWGFLLTNPIQPSKHVIAREDGINVVRTYELDEEGNKINGDVQLGTMSFKMSPNAVWGDLKDDLGFELVPCENHSPRTGIKINIDGISNYEAQSTFRFTDATASKDADLLNIVVSSEQENEENPESSIQKIYDLDPEFKKEIYKYKVTLYDYLDTIDITATLSDKDNATMKIKTPKHDDKGNLVYDDSGGTTIIYEEENLTHGVPFGVTLNKLGDPDTIITIIVTAEDGVTKREYEVTIKRPYAKIIGQIYIGPMASLGIHLANIRIYNSSDVNKIIDWEEAEKTVVNGDTVHQDLLTLKSQNYITNEDGNYEIYVVPGTYDILIDKESYLDCIFISQKLEENDVLDLGLRLLYVGDVNKDGIVSARDVSFVQMQYGFSDTDEGFNANYDFDGNLQITAREISYLNIDYLMTREVNKEID